jgi:hypothetical protein
MPSTTNNAHQPSRKTTITMRYDHKMITHDLGLTLTNTVDVANG